ncbi:unnamed protein product [Penicillium egyptiacum]|uniref:HBS1-like protein N-terminal domain-containing protein n=1 Tax=Penicillium egyptiacum TaxID=1303716 RepID=A0A9W4P364_9EURO|nr:unnamed protein product [Penicillium egyptiacum]
MSRHRIKDVDYDDDDFYDDEEELADPEEQEFLQQCTTAVLQQLGAGQPSVTATKEEVQDALWHYYNDIEKSVNYLRVPAYPAPLSTAHFSAADFFRDCPWLSVPSHRKTDILIEPLYPRLGLLGGAPENGGKLSKLAALAAARKKKEGEKAPSLPETSTPSTTKLEQPKTSLDHPGTSRSLRDRLAASGRSAPKASEGPGSLRRLATPSSSSHPMPKRPESETKKPSVSEVSESMERVVLEAKEEPEPQLTVPTIRASPSTFASTIVGAATGPTAAEPSHLHSTSSDLLRLYGQDHAEPFDFAAPSPDDVVLNAQSTAKGLAIRRKV